MRHDVGMAPEDEDRDGGVLAGLPRSRPQRRSGRRKPAAEASPAAGTGEPPPAEAAASKRSGSARAKAAAGPRAKPARPASKPPKATRASTPKRRTSASPRSGPPARAGAKGSASRLRQPAQPRHVPPQPDRASPAPEPSEEGAHLVGTAVQAAGELAQIGLTVGAQVLRGALSRLPRP